MHSLFQLAKASLDKEALTPPDQIAPPPAGDPMAQAGAPAMDPATGQPLPIDPATGQPMQGTAVDPATGQQLDPATGMPMPPIDPATGQPMPPEGMEMDPTQDPVLGPLFESVSLILKEISQVKKIVAGLADAAGVQLSLNDILEEGENPIAAAAQQVGDKAAAELPDNLVKAERQGGPSSPPDDMERYMYQSPTERLNAAGRVASRFFGSG